MHRPCDPATTLDFPRFDHRKKMRDTDPFYGETKRPFDLTVHDVLIVYLLKES